MKVGDLVKKDYASNDDAPGIIIRKVTDSILYHLDPTSRNSSSINFIIQWPDGSQSVEMPEELRIYLPK
jgi:hypothetical protein